MTNSRAEIAYVKIYMPSINHYKTYVKVISISYVCFIIYLRIKSNFLIIFENDSYKIGNIFVHLFIVLKWYYARFSLEKMGSDYYILRRLPYIMTNEHCFLLKLKNKNCQNIKRLPHSYYFIIISNNLVVFSF